MNAYETEKLVENALSFSDFCEEMKEGLQTSLSDEFSVQSIEVIKAGRGSLKGVTLKHAKCNVCPTIYLEDMYALYQKGTSVKELVHRAISLYEQAKLFNMPMDIFKEYAGVQNRILYRLIPQEGNALYLQQYAHVLFMDLAVVFYYSVPKKYLEGGSIPIKTDFLKNWGITTENLLEDAQKNNKRLMPALLLPLETMLRENVPDSMKGVLESDTFPAPIYVLTNTERSFGGALLYDQEVLLRFAKEKAENYYIIPSSIHELILVPENSLDISVQSLYKMVAEVNHTIVEKDEVLSQKVYYYEGKTGTLSYA